MSRRFGQRFRGMGLQPSLGAALRVLVPLLLLLNACSRPKASGDPGPYWDVKSYFEAEAERLNAEGWGVRKRVVSPEGEEQNTLDSTDWRREWAVFLPYDLAHPERSGRYTVDSIQDAGGYTTVQYRATEDKLHPRSLDLWLDGGSVIAVKISDTTANWLYRSGLNILYEAADGRFTIDAVNKGYLFKDSEFHIEGVAVKNE